MTELVIAYAPWRLRSTTSRIHWRTPGYATTCRIRCRNEGWMYIDVDEPSSEEQSVPASAGLKGDGFEQPTPGGRIDDGLAELA